MGVAERYEKRKKQNAISGVQQRYEWAKKNGGQYVVDQDSINTFISDASTFLSSAEETYAGLGWGNASDVYNSMNSRAYDLGFRSSMISRWIDANRGSIGDESYNSFVSTLDGIDSGVSQVVDGFKQAKDYYAKFKTEDAYNAAVQQQKEQTAMLEFDLGAGQAEIDSLKANRAEIESLKSEFEALREKTSIAGKNDIGSAHMPEVEINKILGRMNEINARLSELGDIDALDTSIAEKELYLRNASRLQSAYALGAVGNPDTEHYDPEFDAYSALGTGIDWKQFGERKIYSGKGAAKVSSIDKYRAAAVALYEHQGNATPEGYEKYDILEKYRRMTDTEFATFAYYLGKDQKEGTNLAKQYIDSIEESINYREANAIYEGMEGKLGLELLFGFEAGLDQFATSIKSLFSKEEYIASSTEQMLSQMVREDLSNSDFKIFGNTIGQLAYDAINATSNMLPSILTSAAVGLINPVAGAGAGAVILGTSASGGAYADMLNLGYTKGQARDYAALVGASEAGLSFLFGGIEALGGKLTGNAASKALLKIDNAYARVAITLGGNMLSEAGEEGLQTILDTWFKRMVTDMDFDSPNIDEVLYSSLLGAITAAGIGGVSTIAGEAMANYKASKIYGGFSQDLINEALEIGTTDSLYFADKYQTRLNAGKTLTGAQLNRLIEFNERGLAANDITKIASAAGARLTELGETGNVEAIASALAKQVAGQKLSLTERVALGKSQYAQRVSNELDPDNAEAGQYTSEWVRDIGTDRINDDVYNLAEEVAGVTPTASPAESTGVGATEDTATQEEATEVEFEASEDGKTIYRDEEVTIKEIAEVKDGEVSLRLDNGETVNASEVSFGSKDEALLYGMVAKMGVGAETANELIAGFTTGSTPVMAYAADAPLAYQYGRINYERGLSELQIPEEQRRIAYNRGRIDAMTDASRKPKPHVARKSKSAKAKKNGIFYEDESIYNEETATDVQKASIKGIETLAKLSPSLEFHVYSTEVKNGKLVAYIDGKLVETSANGFFKNGNKIYIDLNAGNARNGVMLYTLSHEISHYIRAWNAEGFKTLADFLFEHYGENDVPVDELIEKQKAKILNRLKKDGKPIPSEAKLYDMAYEELVADAMSTMFADPKAYEKLADLKMKNPSVFKKLGEAIKKILDKLKSLLGIYKGRTPDASEAHYVMQFAPEVYEQLQDLYLKAFVEAQESHESAVKSGIVDIDSDTNSASPMLSERTWTASEYVTKREETAKKISKALGVSIQTAYKYIDDINGVARLIADDRARLDYEPNLDDKATVLKPNSDYKYSVDMSTLCAKRLLFTGTFDAIQRALPNTVFDSEDIVQLRKMMQKRGYEVACGICYVESTRREIGRITREFIDRYKVAQETGKPISRINSSGKEVVLESASRTFYAEKNYTPNLGELNTTDIDIVKRDHRDVYDAYLAFMNARGQAKPKLLETRAEYKGEILKHFKAKSAVEARNNAGGLRLQSFSDFEVPHMIDMMQIVMDMARVGLKSQAYTKVPAFAEIFGDTGVKINLSLIAKGDGLDSNGNLIFDDVEGINHKEAFKLRDKYSKNVGTILVGKTDAHIIAAMADPRIDYIIPFHKSSWKESLYDALGLTGYADYTETQSEKPLDKDRKIKNFDPSEYWDFSKSGDENAQAYLAKCREDGRIPKFPQFQGYPGYWKLLIDFKMYDNDGVGSPQEVVKPVFNTEASEKILREYKGGHRSFPVAKDVVEDFVKEHKDDAQFSDRDSDTKYSDRVLMGSLFSGGGTLEAGLVYQMLDKEFAVEYNKKIASAYTDNHGKEHMFVGDVREFNSKDKQNVFYLHASPVCKNFSPASHSGGETTLDITTAQATARVLEEQMPQAFTVENVKRYIGSEAYNIITAKLDELGYTWDVDVYKASDYGNATKRERMVIRAVKSGQLPAKPQKVSNITSWGEATKDLWETDLIPSTLVKSKIDAIRNTPRLKGVKLTKLDKPLMIYDTTKSKTVNFAWADELAPTLTTKCGDARIIMPDGRVYAPTPKFMGRIQGLPDDYKYPKAVTNAFKIIGNGIPTQLTKAVMGGVLDSAYEQTHDGEVLYSDRDFPSNAEDVAKEYFGTTKKWSETGWLLKDGTQLDFSGRHWERHPELEISLGESYYGGKRNVEHFEIAEAFSELRDFSSMEYRGEHLDGFMHRGNIRIVGKGCIDLITMPTEEQFEKLGRYFRENIDKYIVIGIGQDGIEFEAGTSASTIVEGIRDYFSKNRGRQSDIMRFHTDYYDADTQYSIREEAPPKKTKEGYKVFVVKNGKLYPPMVANPNAEDTPVGVWLNADVGARAADSKTGRAQVKAGGKGTQGGSGSLAFRPGWHLGETPLATQFDRLNPETGVKELFPENFVWALCDIAADHDYQEEAMSYGRTKSGKFQHSLAGLPRLPVDGYYKYRTNPNPDTVPWLITGAMKVKRLLSDAEVNAILAEKGLPPKQRVGGDKTLADLGLTEYEGKVYSDRDEDSISVQNIMELLKAGKKEMYGYKIKSIYEGVPDKHLPAYSLAFPDGSWRDFHGTWEKDVYLTIAEHIAEDAQKRGLSSSNRSFSTRSLLANALEGAAQNDIERQKLAQYKSKIELIEAEQAKLSEIRLKIRELSFAKGPRDTEQIRSLQFEEKQAANRINTYDRQLLNLQSTTALKNVLEREKKLAYEKAKKEGKQALANYREKAAATQRELITRWQDSRKNAIEGRNKTEMRHRIKAIAKELDTLLRKPTGKKYILEELRKGVADALLAINMDTIGADERVAKYDALIAKAKDPDVIAELTATRDRIQMQGDNLKEKLDALRMAYERIKDSEDIELSMAYQEVIKNSIEAVSQKVGKTSIRDMTLEQLEMVYDLYSMIRKTIRDANKAFKAKKGETITQMAEAVNDQVRTVGGQPYKRNALLAAVQRVGWTFLKPFVAFRTIGSITLTNLYKELRNGEDTFYGDVSEAQAFIEDQYAKHGFKSWDMKETKTFTAKSGKSFDLTLEQMMSLYAYSRRDQAHAHIIEGGIVFEDAVTVEKKHGIPIKYEVTTKDAFNLSEETLDEIVNSLTAEQKAFVEAMQEYLSTTMGAKGNEVSMEMLGVKLFKEKFYLPIKSSQYYLNFSTEEAGEIKLKNPAFSKETVQHANNPIVLHNFTDLWAEHVNNMAMYHSFVLALEDFTRVYNYKTKTDAKVETMSTKKTIETAYPGATNYISNFLKSLNGGVRMDTVGYAEKLTSLAKKGSVLGSASVAIQQPSAVMRAMAVINPVYFVTSAPKSINLLKHRQDWEELKKYAPIAGIKEMGRFDVGMGKDTADWIKVNGNVMTKIDDILSVAPAFMDEVTWVSIWNAVKRETIHKHKNLSPRSDEFLKIAGERFTEVISLTQVYDSVFSRSDLMRNKSWIAKALTAFMAEPTTTLNMLYDSYVQGKRSGSKKGFVKVTTATTGAIVASLVVNAALKSIVMAMRDDDEDESYVEKYVEHFFGDFKDSLNPLTLIPVAKDVVSIFKGYDVERMDMALFSDLKQAIDAFDSDTKTDYEKWSGLIGAISSFFGLPVKNVERDIRGLINTIFGFSNGEETTAAGLLNAMVEGWKGEQKSNAQQLYEAMLNGDKEQIKRIEGRFKDQDAINSAIRKVIREKYEEGELSVRNATNMLTKYADMSKDEAASKVQYWDFKQEYPDYDLTEAAVGKYYSEVEPSGISIEVYYDYIKKRAECEGTDSDGDGKTDSGSMKREVMKVINSLPISAKQKDALYFLNGWSAKTLYEAPWH